MSKIIVGVDGPDRPTTRSRSPRAWPVAPRRRSCSRAPTHTTTPRYLGDSNGATVCARRAADARRATGARRRGLHHDAHDRRHLALEGAAHLAEIERASLVVIGSSHRGAVGRVFAGTTAERLLHGAPCPVAGAAGHGPRRGDLADRRRLGRIRRGHGSARRRGRDRPRGRRRAARRRGPRHPVGRNARDHTRVGSGPRGEQFRCARPRPPRRGRFRPAGGCASRPPS